MQSENEQRPYNALIDGEDYFAQYNESIKSNYNKLHFKYIELTKAIFNNEKGKEWLKIAADNLAAHFVDFNSTNAELEMAALQGSRAVIHKIELILKNAESQENK